MREQDNLAPLPIRGAAYLIDVITPTAGFMLFASGVISVFDYGMSIGLGDYAGHERAPGFPLWTLPLIFGGAGVSVGGFIWWLIALKDGRTPGKKIVGIRVVKISTGETPGWGMMFVREILAKFVLFALILGSLILGMIWLTESQSYPLGIVLTLGGAAQLFSLLLPLWDANSQALHDKIVGTQVVRN